MEVSTRELRLKLSEYIRLARAGNVIVVTRRGRPVAALAPLANMPLKLGEPRAEYGVHRDSERRVGVRELKAKPGRELQVHGSGALFRWLFDNDFVDELNLFIFPVVVGQGTRLFPDIGPDRSLELVQSRSTPGGVAIHVYRSTGRPGVGRS